MYFHGPEDQLPASGGEAPKARARAREAGRIGRAREAGNAILQVIFILGVLMIAIYLIADKIQTHRNVVLQSGSVIKARFALHSLMDFTYYAVQRRFCLSNTLLNATPCELNTLGSDGGIRSIERVLMSPEQALNIARMVKGSPICTAISLPDCPYITPVAVPGIDLKIDVPPNSPLSLEAIQNEALKLDKIDIRVKAKDIPPTHPVYPVVEPLSQVMRLELKNASKWRDLDLTVRLQINRDWGQTVNRTGNEVYFWVVISLEDGTGKVLTVNNVQLKVASYGTLFQREVGSFALMVPQDLYLDGSAGEANKDISFPVATGGSFTGPGLVFMSPVFVNRDVHLPLVAGADGQKKREVKYAPVTFADRVVIGNGRVIEGDKTSGKPYRPNQSGGRDSLLWADNKLFGGFKAGILVDGQFDRGLSVFGKSETANPADDALMVQCNLRYAAQNDLEKIKVSEFYANRDMAAPAGKFKYRLGMTDGNRFYPQGVPFGGVDLNAWLSPSKFERVPDESAGNPAVQERAKDAVLLLEVRLGTRMVGTLRMNENTEVTLEPEVATQALEDELKLEWETARDQTTPPLPTPDEIAEKKKAYDDLKALRNTSKPKITIKSAPVTLGSGVQTGLLDLEITVEDAAGLLDGTKPVVPKAPQIKVLAYDPVHNAHGVVNASMVTPIDYVTTKKTRWLNFEIDGAGVVQAPERFSLAAGGPLVDPAIPNDETDWLKLDSDCEKARNAASGQSFGAAAWNIDFATRSTFKSWNFHDGTDVPPTPKAEHSLPDGVVTDGIEFTEANSRMAPYDSITVNPADGKIVGRDEFKVASIARDCVIRSKARLVTGFFTCHNLLIEKRAAGYPLYIIGTFVVRNIEFIQAGSYNAASGSWTTDPDGAINSFKQGIYWMSIYHPDAPQILRESKVLRPMKQTAAGKRMGTCQDGASATDLPIWAQEALPMSRIQDNRACNVVSLRGKSAPHQWTAIDPDCGLPPGMISGNMCKNHPVNFFVMEHTRGGGP